VQTQFCMDAGVVRRYAARVAEAGLDVPLLIGVAPLRSARSALWMRKHLFGTIIPDDIVARLETAGDPAAEGRRICVALMQEFREIPGVAGVHIMAPNNDAAVPQVIAAVRRA
jgi:methylenetetrahydrofolate reductase (NADPH)